MDSRAYLIRYAEERKGEQSEFNEPMTGARPLMNYGWRKLNPGVLYAPNQNSEALYAMTHRPSIEKRGRVPGDGRKRGRVA